MSDGRKLLLIDGHALLHRAFHALPDLSTSSGEMTNAVFGFSSMVLKAIETLAPSHVILTMDRPAPTFRHKAYAEYKATRARVSPDLLPQFKRAREVAEAMNMSIYEMDGFEADDLLGTLSLEADRAGLPTVIVTGDLDTLQLVSDEVHVMMASRGLSETVVYTPAGVRERFGLSPEQLPDYKALVGDKSDNIPGAPGIGAKTASKVIGQYNDLEGLYDHLGEVPDRYRQSLEQNRDQIFQSRMLARITRDAPISLDLAGSAFRDINRFELINLFRELEFNSLIPRLQSVTAPAEVAGEPHQLSIFGEDEQTERSSGAQLHAARDLKVRLVRTPEELGALVDALRRAEEFAVDTESTSVDPLAASLVGLSFASRAGEGWYVPVGHVEGEQLPVEVVLEALRPVLEDQSVRKIGHNLKYDFLVLAQHGVNLAGLSFDTMLAAYLINPTSRSFSLASQAMIELGLEMTPIEELIGKGKSQITMDRVSIERTAVYAAADADVSLRLREPLAAKLDGMQLQKLFEQVEMPLLSVLARMELIGVGLDTAVLGAMSQEMSEEIGRLEGRIYELAGRRFNISSTQQLGQLLFTELKLPSGRRTKTGYSTDSDTLQALSGKHEIVDLILEYRQLIKLKNTYVDALPSLISPRDRRVHTDFNQTVAATGRLSSSNPNLQNIPVRGDLGRRIRKAFVPAKEGRVLLAADYSQIELRILAAMSEDEVLSEAFRRHQDIHRVTAARIFGMEPEAVSSDQRRLAKVVNFGIVYGIGENRLAQQTGISREEARSFIANYHETYAGVTHFMDQIRKRAAMYGWVETALGRRRPTQDVLSPHQGIRLAAERAAVNMPIQGTAADVIKIAMIRLDRVLQERFPASDMILQVHDELVFEVPEEDTNEVAMLVRQEMEHALELAVPLEVEIKAGRDWYNMEALQ
ncbi:MAG: DNA polymerase I [Chloroflexota bacterium]